MSDTADIGLYAQVSATVIPDTNVNRYRASRLWLVYGISLASTLLADGYGLIFIFRNGGAMKRTFSSIAASVRSRELDTLLNEPREPLPVRAEKAKLRYRTGAYVKGDRAGFTIAKDIVKDEDNREMSEVAVLTHDSEARP